MLVVVAGVHDRAAHDLVARWSAHRARLMTPADLSVAGWRYRPGEADASCAIADGQPLASNEIGAVLSRLPWVAEHDLTHIAAADRAYVAAEMSAVLLAWLTELPCPVVNRPTPTCLAGPHWRRELWVRRATQLGVPVVPVHRVLVPGGNASAGPVPPRSDVTVAIVGDRHVGEVSPMLTEWAHRLAKVAGVDLLAVRFDGAGPDARFVDADFWPDVADPDVADAVLAHLLTLQGRR